MANVLRGDYESIRLEPPGAEGAGVEFWLRSGDAREYHQVKRRGARCGRWTLRELNDAGVLRAFRSHLADANATCVFVSMQGADELGEFAGRARDARDQEEFQRNFTEGEWASRLSGLLTYWPGCTRAEAFALLRRIHVRTIDEDTLCRYAEVALRQLVEGDASAASDVLFAYAFDSVHQELDSARIWNRLTSHGLKRPIWTEPQTLTDLVEAANERYLTRLDRELIRGEPIHRDEGARVLASLQEGAGKRGVILTGVAGCGKSTVLLQVIKSLKQQGTPVLAFRIDRLEPTQRPDEAGTQIGLSASPVPTLAALAKDQPCVLVLDQLDAVSVMSGRNSWFFDCFDEIVRQALTLPAMHLLIACRRFDFENDHRLRRLGGAGDVFEIVEVGPLSDDTVRKTVQALGIEASRLTDRQVKLLSVAAHLKLLCEVAQGAQTSLTFQTANDLYDLYWDRKDQLLRARPGPALAWSPLIDRLCDYMNQRQRLSAPATAFDDATAIRDALLSEHVLVRDGARISFSHEGFFDYAFARRFVAASGDLVKLLRSAEQHLFRRAQVRQILLHERQLDRRVYLNDLKTLLTSRDIRFHIKHVVFALLAQFTDPTEEEWRILEALLQDPAYAHRPEVWFAPRTLPWFRLLDSLGVVANWLAQSEPYTVDQAVTLLHGLPRDAADRVAELVEPYIGASEEWRKRHRYLVEWADLDAGRRFFDLFLRLVDNGDLDAAGPFRQGDLLGMLHELPKSRADWACEAMAHCLSRRLSVARDSSETHPFGDTVALGHSQSSERVLIGSAQRAPRAFIEHLLPFVLHVLELHALREGETPWKDTVWRLRHIDIGHTVADHLLRAMEEALRKLARDAPDEFDRLAAPLRQSEYETVQFLLIRAYTANGARFADQAIDFLCECPRRLSFGYLDSSHRPSRELIEATTPFCSPERLATLEATLLGYYPDCERTAGGRQQRGLAQFELLLAIDETRRSESVDGRIGQCKRKFRLKSPPEPVLTGFYTVGSPISATAAEKMTDDHWLGAVARYSDDDEGRRRDGEIVGGAYELSQILEAQVRKEPVRFARLLLRFPDAASPAYFHAVLRGLTVGTADAPAICEACRRCHRLPERPAGSAFCHLAAKLPELPWPDDLLDAVAWYATQDPDPDREYWRTEASSGKCYYDGDIYTAGINSVRGAAAGAVRALLFADAERIPRFLTTLRRMVRDPSIAVRSCVVTALFPVLNRDRDLAVDLFLELCDTEDVLLKTRGIEEFIRYAARTHFGRLRPIVERMLCSPDPEVAQTGARQACLASLGLEDAADLAEACLSGSEPLRAGAAQVFAANLGDARFRSICEARLPRLFDDPTDNVRAIAAECFDHLEGEALGEVTTLVDRFQTSAAFAASHEHLIRALEETTARLPQATISVCERFIKIAGPDAGDIRTRIASGANRLSKLIIRAYHQAPDEAISTRCLDTIDNLLRTGAFGLNRALDEFDR